MTHPSDIAGLIDGWSCDERRREKECRNPNGCHCREITALSARVKELEAENVRLTELANQRWRETKAAEQQRDEAYERAVEAILALRIRAACNFIDDNCKGQRGQDRTDALADAANEVRRLASSPEGGSALTAASDGEVKPSDSSGSEG